MIAGSLNDAAVKPTLLSRDVDRITGIEMIDALCPFNAARCGRHRDPSITGIPA